MTLGEAMVKYRAKHNMSQPELAMLCKVSTMTISILERGLREPSRVTRTKIEYILYGKKGVNGDASDIR